MLILYLGRLILFSFLDWICFSIGFFWAISWKRCQPRPRENSFSTGFPSLPGFAAGEFLCFIGPAG